MFPFWTDGCYAAGIIPPATNSSAVNMRHKSIHVIPHKWREAPRRCGTHRRAHSDFRVDPACAAEAASAFALRASTDVSTRRRPGSSRTRSVRDDRVVVEVSAQPQFTARYSHPHTA
jgi:hypothetical protein